MPLPTDIDDLSTTADDNYPAAGDAVAPDIDNLLRFHSASIAFVRDWSRRVVWADDPQYGVTGANLVDDTAAIEAAITAAGTGGIVILKPGMNCRIDSEVTVSSGVEIIGYGATLTKYATFTGSTVVRITAANAKIRGLTIVGTDNADDGVRTQAGADGFEAHDMTISGCLYGISANDIHRVKIDGCKLSDNDSGDIRIHNIAGTQNLVGIKVLNCIFDRVSLGAFLTNPALLIRGSETYRHEGVVVDGCRFLLPAEPGDSACMGCELRFCEGASFVNNYADGGSMIVSVANCLNPNIDGNTGIGQNFWAIEVAAAPSTSTVPQTTSVTGNTINGQGLCRHGIGIQGILGGENLSVVGNSIVGILETGIYVNEDWAQASITGNAVEMAATVGETQRAIWLVDVGASFSLAGNTLVGDGSTEYAIQLNNCDGVSIGSGVIDNWTVGVRIVSSTATDNIGVTGVTFTNCASQVEEVSSGGTFGSNIQVSGCPGFAPTGTSGANCLDLTAGIYDAWGTGTPEGSFAAGVGSTYRWKNGGAGTTFLVKESGTGDTGWVGK